MIVEPEKKIFTYNVDRHLTPVLQDTGFTYSAEVIPPRNGASEKKTMTTLQSIVDADVDFLSVTKGAGGSLRGGSLPITQMIKDHHSRPCIAHFTCRDLTPQEIENLLIDHHYFGVRNILALRGDPPMGEQEWAPREGGYSFAYQLIQQIREMNEGKFLQRDGFQVESREKTNFCIGCAVYPEHPDPNERFEFARLKFAEGAEYGITQMLFDPNIYESFMNLLRQGGVKAPVLPGVRILRSQKQGRIMRDRFGCSVPDAYLKALPEEHEKGVFNPGVLPPFFKMVEQLKAAGAPGVHIFVLSDIEECQQAMAHFRRNP